MKRLALIALALVACQKDKGKAKDEPKAPAKDAALTCAEVAKNPVIAADPGTAKKFLDYCKESPADFPQPLLRCLMDAKAEADLDLCEDGEQPTEPEPRRSEAELNLDRIKQAAKASYIEQAGFPLGEVALTPARPCCEGDNLVKKCSVDPALWTSGDPAAPSVWDQLDFSIDEQHFYQYSYKGTAAGFTAMAVGDLDCDQTYVTYTMEGSVAAGNTIFKLTKPITAD